MAGRMASRATGTGAVRGGGPVWWRMSFLWVLMSGAVLGPLGPPKVKCGPATVRQPRLPSRGVHCLVSSIRVRLAVECPMGPLCCSLPSLGLGWRCGLLGSGLYRQGTPHYGLRLGPGVHAVFHVGSHCTWGVGGGGGWTGGYTHHRSGERPRDPQMCHPHGGGGGGLLDIHPPTGPWPLAQRQKRQPIPCGACGAETPPN